MLVLSRKLNQEVVIGRGITVKVLEITNGRVRLGIVAPPDVVVHRLEVAERIDGRRLVVAW